MSIRKEKDTITPYKISLLLLIEKYGSSLPKFWNNNLDSEFPSFFENSPEFTPQESNATCMLISNFIQGGENDVSLSDVIKAVNSSSVSSLYASSFVNRLRELYVNGIEVIHSLFDSVEKFCIQDKQRNEAFPCLWTSSVGLYLRQLNLTFRRMDISQIIALYDKFKIYYDDCFKNNISSHDDVSYMYTHLVDPSNQSNSVVREYEESEAEMDHSSFLGDSLSPVTSPSVTPKHTSSNKHMAKIKFCLPSESRPRSSNTPLKSRQQAEIFIQEQICLLLQQNPGALPSDKLQKALVDILKNFPDLGKAYFLSYLNCLRTREFPGAIHSLVRAYDSKLIYKDISRGEDITRTFRYAALNMAALQAQFGHRSLGLMYLEEAIRLAQESNDHVCLQYSLAWLYILSKSQKLPLMKRSLCRSSELHIPQLTWVSLMNHAIQLSKCRAQPRIVLKNLLDLFSGQNLPWSWSEGSLASQPALWAVHSGLWSTWGNLTLSSVCAQLVLHMSPQTVTNIHAPSSSSPICASLCNMAFMFASLGEFKLSSDIIHHTQEQFPSSSEHSKLWMFTQCYIAFYESLRQGYWSQASTFASSMSSIHPSYAKLLQAELRVAKGEYSEANKIADNLLDEHSSVQFGDVDGTLGDLVEPEIEINCMLIKANALSGGHNLGAALCTLVKAISTAKQYHMIYLSSLAYLQMSCIQMHLGLLREARKSFDKGVDVVFSGGGSFDQARAKLLQAKLEVCCSNKSNFNEKLTFAANLVEEAQLLFARVKAVAREKEAVYLKARFYNACGRLEERNCSALQFRQLEQRNPSVEVVANTCFL